MPAKQRVRATIYSCEKIVASSLPSSAARSAAPRSRGRGCGTGMSSAIRPSSSTIDAVGQRHRLGHIMRDEQRRETLLPPDPLDQPLHGDAGQRVERAERLVEGQESGRLTKARASATRWRWPPDSRAGHSPAFSVELHLGQRRRDCAPRRRRHDAAEADRDVAGNALPTAAAAAPGRRCA